LRSRSGSRFPAAVDQDGEAVLAVVHAEGNCHPAPDVGAECIATAFAQPFPHTGRAL